VAAASLFPTVSGSPFGNSTLEGRQTGCIPAPENCDGGKTQRAYRRTYSDILLKREPDVLEVHSQCGILHRGAVLRWPFLWNDDRWEDPSASLSLLTHVFHRPVAPASLRADPAASTTRAAWAVCAAPMFVDFYC
jgi:hypothetical protein